MKTDEIREQYLSFFETKGCVRRPSDVLVPQWDPSVLFTPAGMNQFKDHFLGKCKLDFTRATTCQKCLRTGDIENVGRTAYHHTFFEMMGNFSFGDYFKREAIAWAWEFLTDKKWLNLDPDRLSVTVYEDDSEAYGIWNDEIKLPPSRIRRLGENDNFWPANAPTQGPDGVCGPCSEIFYHNTPDEEVEIWNLVFTQFNRVGDPPGNLRPLPSQNIDTGMGLERTAAVLQGVDSNFDIDIFRPLVETAAEVCGVKYDPASENGRRMRRIADHVRACVFAIHENVYPGPNKEKYVIKRLLRRAVLDGHQVGVHEPFLHQMVDAVADIMQGPYPELKQTAQRVAQVIRREESNFLATIDAGLERIERIVGAMKAAGRVMVGGAEAADMYTTHGFPPELFESLSAENNLTFDWEGFHREMQQHGLDSGGGQRLELFQSSPLDALKKAMHGTEFLGYETTEAQCKVVGLIAQDQLCEAIDEIGHEQPVVVVLAKTPFYAESGGQVGDLGQIIGSDFQFDVLDTRKEGDFHLHLGHLREGKLALGALVTARVDAPRRQGIRRAHSATHLLHKALQARLGEHAQQQGSKVDCDWLRFDFTNPQAVDRDELTKIEDDVNRYVTQSEPIRWSTLPLAAAREAGAMMLFGEKYPDEVRMVEMGDFSKELCGGTHLNNTGEVGLFRIVGEESVSAGTRRITAMTGPAALADMHQHENVLGQVATLLKSPTDAIPQRVETLLKEVRDLKKQLAAIPTKGETTSEELLASAFDVGGTKVVVAEIPNAQPPAMRQYIDHLRQKTAPVAVMLGSAVNGKVLLVAGISRDLAQGGLSAVDWIGPAAELVGGRGGGRPDMAQAGGKEPAQLAAALEQGRSTIRGLLG